MKNMKTNKYIGLIVSILFLSLGYKLDAQKDSVKSKEIIKLSYYNHNSVQYILIDHFNKKGKQLTPISDQSFYLYLDSIGADHKIASVTTDMNGKAKCFIPPSLKSIWDAKPIHTFMAAKDAEAEESDSDLEITKSKIEIDTATEDGVSHIIAKVMKAENNSWIAADEVELKVGIQRLGGMLSAGEEETYTTDTSGSVSVDLNKEHLPGDESGNIILVAKVDDHEQFGNLLFDLSVPWGVPTTIDQNFFKQRTLWSTQFRTPFWLLFMAYSIVIGVWGTIFYLIFQIVKIKKIGDRTTAV